MGEKSRYVHKPGLCNKWDCANRNIKCKICDSEYSEYKVNENFNIK